MNLIFFNQIHHSIKFKQYKDKDNFFLLYLVKSVEDENKILKMRCQNIKLFFRFRCRKFLPNLILYSNNIQNQNTIHSQNTNINLLHNFS